MDVLKEPVARLFELSWAKKHAAGLHKNASLVSSASGFNLVSCAKLVQAEFTEPFGIAR